MLLQIKSVNQIKLYGFIIGGIIIFGLIFYILKKPFREYINDYIKNHKFFLVGYSMDVAPCSGHIDPSIDFDLKR